PARSTTIRVRGRSCTSSSARRRPGTRSPTTCRATRPTRPDRIRRCPGAPEPWRRARHAAAGPRASSPASRCWRASGRSGCAAGGKEVVVLDRPNPLGGELLEGNLIRRGYTSFVGLYPVPMRHGLTLGELAALVNLRMAGGEGGPGGRSDGIRVRCPGRCALSVVRTEGWRRRMLFPDTGLPWVLPSPNMPTFDTAVVYPGQVLLEGTNLSEGR